MKRLITLPFNAFAGAPGLSFRLDFISFKPSFLFTQKPIHVCLVKYLTSVYYPHHSINWIFCLRKRISGEENKQTRLVFTWPSPAFPLITIAYIKPLPMPVYPRQGRPMNACVHTSVDFHRLWHTIRLPSHPWSLWFTLKTSRGVWMETLVTV